MAKEHACEFLDASLMITASHKDGIHFDKDQCTILGNAVTEKVSQVLNG